MAEHEDRRGCPWHSGIEARMVAAENNMGKVEANMDKIWAKIDRMVGAAWVAMGAVILQLLIMLKEAWL